MATNTLNFLYGQEDHRVFVFFVPLSIWKLERLPWTNFAEQKRVAFPPVRLSSVPWTGSMPVNVNTVKTGNDWNASNKLNSQSVKHNPAAVLPRQVSGGRGRRGWPMVQRANIYLASTYLTTTPRFLPPSLPHSGSSVCALNWRKNKKCSERYALTPDRVKISSKVLSSLSHDYCYCHTHDRDFRHRECGSVLRP